VELLVNFVDSSPTVWHDEIQCTGRWQLWSQRWSANIWDLYWWSISSRCGYSGCLTTADLLLWLCRSSLLYAPLHHVHHVHFSNILYNHLCCRLFYWYVLYGNHNCEVTWR